MIGFHSEFGLRKESGRITLSLASLSKGQPEVTRLILNPIVQQLLNLLYSLACARWQPFRKPLMGLRSYSPTLEAAGFYAGSVFSGSVFSGSV